MCGCGKIKTVDNGMLGADCEERDVGRGMLGGDRGERDRGTMAMSTLPDPRRLVIPRA